MTFEYRDLIMNVLPEGHGGKGEKKGGKTPTPDCVPTETQSTNCTTACGDGDKNKEKRYAADLALLKRQVQESLNQTP
jgi:hypothetical protein